MDEGEVYFKRGAGRVFLTNYRGKCELTILFFCIAYFIKRVSIWWISGQKVPQHSHPAGRR